MDGRDKYDMMVGHGSHGRSEFDGLSPARLHFTTCRDAGGNVLGIAEAMNLGRIPGPQCVIAIIEIGACLP
jgi:hypothetical protein